MKPMNRRFDDIIEVWNRGERFRIHDMIAEYDKVTTKWPFWDYLKETVELGGIDDRTALEICLYYLRK